MSGRTLDAALRAALRALIVGASLLLAATNVRAQEEPALTTEAAPSPEPFVIEVFAGAGMGSRAFQRPLEEGLERLDESVFPALEAGVRARVFPQARFGLEGLLRYQTSIGFAIEQRPWFAPANEVAVRAECVELSIAPRLSFGEPASAPSVLLPIGFTVRALWPAVAQAARASAGPAPRTTAMRTP